MNSITEFVKVLSPSNAAQLAETFQFKQNQPVISETNDTENFDQFDEFLIAYTDIQLKEDEIRYQLANDQNPEIKPLKVYENTTFKQLQPINSPTYFSKQNQAQNIIPIVEKELFISNFKAFTSDIFTGIDMKNFVVAGGSVLSCLLPNCEFSTLNSTDKQQFTNDLVEMASRFSLSTPKACSGINGFFTSDIDLFVYGIEEIEAEKRINQLITQLQEKLNSKLVFRSNQAISLLSNGRDIQIVFRLYKNISEIMVGFDIDCAAVVYDFNDVYMTERSQFAIWNRTNVVNQYRRSMNYSQRLIKYAQRGFQICVPGFSRNLLIVQNLSENNNNCDEKAHYRTRGEQIYLEGLVAGQKVKNSIIQCDLNDIIESEIGVQFNYLGLENNVYSNMLKQMCIVAQNEKIENRIQNSMNTLIRQQQSGSTKLFKKSKAVVQSCIQIEDIQENAVTYTQVKTVETDVLSHQYAYQSDYCTPISFGFHSNQAIAYSLEHPIYNKNLFIGEFKPTKVTLTVKNPGKQDLFTSSFHPDTSYSFYGDLRVFCGPSVFKLPNITTKQSLIYKLFFLNHFCSLPHQISKDIVQSKDEVKNFDNFELLKSEINNTKDLFQLDQKLKKMRSLIENCQQICILRQIRSENKIVIKENDRKVLDWTWYLTVDEIAQIDENSSLQAKLCKTYFKDIQQAKERGNMMETYQTQEKWLSVMENQFRTDIDLLYQKTVNNDTSATVLGQEIQLSNKNIVLECLKNLEILQICDIKLFEIQKIQFQQEYNNNKLDITYQLELNEKSIEILSKLIKTQISSSFLHQSSISILPDLSFFQLQFSLSNVYKFNEFILELSSFDSIYNFYNQFKSLVNNYSIHPINNNLFVFNNEIFFFNFSEEKQQKILPENVQNYLIETIGVQSNFILEMEKYTPKSNYSIEVPLQLIRELFMKKRKFSEVSYDLKQVEKSDIFTIFRILKSGQSSLSLSKDGLFYSVIDVFEFLEKIEFEEMNTNEAYLYGKAVNYALMNSIQFEINAPFLFFRSILIGKFYVYNKKQAENARFDLILAEQSGVEEVLVNGMKVKKGEIDQDQFDCICANQLFSKDQVKLSSMIDGFQDMGGVKQYSVLNAIQIQKVITGK